MEILYFTVAAIFLYVAADWILNRIETAAGRRFEYRSLIFFFILLVMALTSFALIQKFAGSKPQLGYAPGGIEHPVKQTSFMPKKGGLARFYSLLT